MSSSIINRQLARLLLCLVILSGTIVKSYSQVIDDKKLLEQIVRAGFDKAYPACVKLYAYDTVSKQQAGGVFSGVVVSKEGYIFTVAHVSNPGIIYKVSFPDGKTCLATGLGKIMLAEDKTRPDVAMIRIISPGTWPYAQTGSSTALKAYEPCLSISYPESLDQPKPILRFGYVMNVRNDRGFIQSTCLMEPGDSGGPLFDYSGRLIGMHSAIEIPEQDNYDVPVDLFQKYFTALKSPKVYESYPVYEDPVPANSTTAGNITLPMPGHKEEPGKAASRAGNECLFVQSTVQGKVQRVNGTLFSFDHTTAGQDYANGVIITKNSLVGDRPEILTHAGQQIPARIIVRNKENDLVLLAPAAVIKGGISYKQLTAAAKPAIPQPGIFLTSAQPDTTGISSVCGSSVFSIKKMTSVGFLGLGFKGREAPLKVSYVFPGLNQSIYQLHIGDEIIGLNGANVLNLDALFKQLQYFWPGDSISLQIRRSDTLLTKSIVLDTLPQRHSTHPAEMFAGGKSARRDGFNAVFTHDAIITPARCGGPVFDLSGNFYGINIARFSRASCLAVPSTVICNLINSIISVNRPDRL